MKCPSLVFLATISVGGMGCASQEMHCGLEFEQLERYPEPVDFSYSGPLGAPPDNLVFYSLGQSSESIALVGCGGDPAEQWRVDTQVEVPMEEPLPYSFSEESTRSSLIVQITSGSKGSIRRSALAERRGLIRKFDPTTGEVDLEIEGSNHDHSASFHLRARGTLEQDLVQAHARLDGQWELTALPTTAEQEAFRLKLRLVEDQLSPVGGPIAGSLCASACDGTSLTGRFAMPTLALEWTQDDVEHSLLVTWLDDDHFNGNVALSRGNTFVGSWNVSLVRQ